MIIDPGSTAVICVECQQGVLGDASILPDLRDAALPVIAGIERLVHAARRAGALVVHATYEGSHGARDHGSAPLWRALGPMTRTWAHSHPATDILPQLYSPDDLVSPRHHGLCPATGTELLPLMAAMGRRTLVLAGVSLNVALPLTAGEAVHAGFRVVVPRDAVVGTPAAYGEQVLTHTMAMLATLTTVDELAAGWAGHAEQAAAQTAATDGAENPV